MESTWEKRDLPVLEAAVRYFEDGDGSKLPQAFDLAPMVGLDADVVGKALRVLNGTYLRADAGTMGGLRTIGVDEIYAEGRRAVGQWPSPEAMADRIVAALERAAEKTSDPEERSKLRQLIGWLGTAGRDVLVDVTAAVVTRQSGMG